MTAEEFKQETGSCREKLVSIAAGYLKNRDAAQDIVQDALLKLWTMCSELRSPLLPLASVLTRNLSLDRLRRHLPVQSLSAEDAADGGDERTEHERIEHMMHLIESLPARQQVFLRLRHLQGMEYGDIARLAGCTETTARKAVSRARQAVRDQFLKEQRQ
ncbi:RNA polymerase sigma factor [Prevotella sp. kh1p2]|uniref:RNA polymerase sigma factor n=1 Tax=Prevotella sp. kh1p2 TaxID=1761883 RepID=UPI0008B238E0|nr:RNA polymerase sigma factor [Prevotella sp. kh1p2]SES70311.1 RNA polymerase sigma-70 factor, ECF subfamily [Prevotella sp. kh1p2]SNU10361.1 RNA polymerase sigma-70 factor, ECF subfamily [Prevotellaceae bacterium KH2P17]